MSKNRLEAFSDGVLAILITIMVLELKVPHGSDLAAVRSLGVVFLSYVLSFIYVGIYWNNHHHLFQVVHKVSGSVLWANLHLLFWLSLIPFVTGWMGEHPFQPWPVALYGVVLLASGFSYLILTRCLLQVPNQNSALAKALGKGRKGILSVVLYAVGIPLSLFLPVVAYSIYAVVALIWLVPDKRIEKVL